MKIVYNLSPSVNNLHIDFVGSVAPIGILTTRVRTVALLLVPRSGMVLYICYITDRAEFIFVPVLVCRLSVVL